MLLGPGYFVDAINIIFWGEMYQYLYYLFNSLIFQIIMLKIAFDPLNS